jgi:hypothetical protein
VPTAKAIGHGATSKSDAQAADADVQEVLCVDELVAPQIHRERMVENR